MKKDRHSVPLQHGGKCRTLRKFYVLACWLFCGLVSQAAGQLQNTTVTLDLRGATMEEFARQVKQQTGYTFFYNDLTAPELEPITLQTENKLLGDVLREVVGSRGYDFVVEGA